MKKIPKLRFPEFTGEWEEKKLKEIYEFKYGQFNNNPDNGGVYPVYGANGIIGGYNEYNSEKAIVIGHMGAYAGKVLWEERKHFVTYNGTIGKPKNDKILNSKFGYYMLLNKNIQKICAGSGQPFLSYDDLNNVKVICSGNVLEQEKIVSFLSKVDESIEILEEEKELWEKYKKGMMQKIFSQKLRFKDENGKNYSEWKIKKLVECSKIYDGTHNTPNYKEKGVQFYSVENVTNNNFINTKFISQEDFDKECKRVKIEKGDVLMTRIGDIGTSKYISWDVNASFYVSLSLIKVFEKELAGKYLNYFIKTYFFQKELHKKTLHVAFPKKINLSEIGECLIKLPSLQEQEKIAEFLCAIDEKIELVQEELESVKELKKGLLQQMFV